MSNRSLIQRAAAMMWVFAVVAACGGGGGIDVNIQENDWPWPWPGDADVRVEKTFTDTVTVENHLGIRLEGVNGEIEITGRSDADAVTVTADVGVGSDSFEDAQAGLDKTQVQVTKTTDEILIQTVHPQSTQGRQYVVDYVITLPDDLSVAVNSVNGHVAVTGIENVTDVELQNGNVRLSNIVGDATVSLVNGSVDGTVALPPNGEIRLTTVNGSLDLQIPRSTSAELSATVVNGTIFWDNLDLMGIQQTRQSLTGTLGDGAGLIELETTNGDIEVVGLNE